MSDALFDILRKVTTATITTMLLKKGIRRCWMNGAKPLVPGGERLVGPAFTLRFVPVREDLATPESWASPISTRAAIEAMPEGVIAVADAMGVPSAGIFGDILCARMKKRNVTALVTDGVMRDLTGVLASTAAGMVRRRRRAGLRQRPDLRRLAGADRLRRLRDLSRRRDRGRRRRRRRHPAGAGGIRRPRRRRARALRKLGVHRSREGREAARPLSAERRSQSALRGVAKVARLDLSRAAESDAAQLLKSHGGKRICFSSSPSCSAFWCCRRTSVVEIGLVGIILAAARVSGGWRAGSSSPASC